MKKLKGKTRGKTRALVSPALFAMFLAPWSVRDGTMPSMDNGCFGGCRGKTGEGTQAHLPA